MGSKAGKWEIERENIQGIKIHNLNYVMVVLTCLIYMFLLFLTMDGYKNYKNLEESTQKYISCDQAADDLRSGSDYLTEQVRFFAETGNVEYMDAYFTEAKETRRRDQALDKLIQMDVKPELEKELTTALRWSNELMDVECYSMRLTAESYGIDITKLPGEIQQINLSEEDNNLDRVQMEMKARMLLFDDTYSQYKDSIYLHLDKMLEEMLNETQGKITGNTKALAKSLNEQRIMITVLFVLNLLMFVFIIILIIRPLKIYINNIKKDTLIDIVGAYEFKYLALTYNNIYEINALNKENQHYHAEHDKLTGVLNRTAFEGLTRYLEKAQIPMALLIIDVDRFKDVNDTYGYETGNAVLKRIANMLQNNTRSGDKVIRYGGDEFIVIMSDITVEKAHIVSDKVSDFNKILMTPEDGFPAVSLSVGAAFSEAGYDDTVLKKADDALYRIKNSGRCGCEFADDVPVG